LQPQLTPLSSHQGQLIPSWEESIEEKQLNEYPLLTPESQTKSISGLNFAILLQKFLVNQFFCRFESLC